MAPLLVTWRPPPGDDLQSWHGAELARAPRTVSALGAPVNTQLAEWRGSPWGSGPPCTLFLRFEVELGGGSHGEELTRPQGTGPLGASLSPLTWT